MAGWRLVRADGTGLRESLSLAEVRELLQKGTYGPDDLIAGPTQDVMLVIRSVAALQRYVPATRAGGAPSPPARRQPIEQAPPAESGKPAPRVSAPILPRPTAQTRGREAAAGRVGRFASPSAVSASPAGAAFSASQRRRGSPGEGSSEDIDITPMIDVVFQLLIFFMVCAVLQKEYGISSPESASGDAMDANRCVVVCLKAKAADEAGVPQVTIYMGDEAATEISVERAVELVREQLQAGEKQTVVVKADRLVHFAAVRDLTAALKRGTSARVVTGVREKGQRGS